MGNSLIQCDQGSDSICKAIDLNNKNMCCMYLKVDKSNDSPSTTQQQEIDKMKMVGFPVESGSSGHFCFDKSAAETNFKDGAAWTDTNTGLSYKGYCDQAKQTAMQAAVFIGMLCISNSF